MKFKQELISQFLESVIKVERGIIYPVGDMYEMFLEWVDDLGIQESISKIRFGKLLTEMGWGASKVKNKTVRIPPDDLLWQQYYDKLILKNKITRLYYDAMPYLDKLDESLRLQKHYIDNLMGRFDKGEILERQVIADEIDRLLFKYVPEGKDYYEDFEMADQIEISLKMENEFQTHAMSLLSLNQLNILKQILHGKYIEVTNNFKDSQSSNTKKIPDCFIKLGIDVEKPTEKELEIAYLRKASKFRTKSGGEDLHELLKIQIAYQEALELIKT